MHVLVSLLTLSIHVFDLLFCRLDLYCVPFPHETLHSVQDDHWSHSHTSGLLSTEIRSRKVYVSVIHHFYIRIFKHVKDSFEYWSHFVSLMFRTLERHFSSVCISNIDHFVSHGISICIYRFIPHGRFMCRPLPHGRFISIPFRISCKIYLNNCS